MNPKQREQQKKEAERVAAFYTAYCDNCDHPEADHQSGVGRCEVDDCQCQKFCEVDL